MKKKKKEEMVPPLSILNNETLSKINLLIASQNPFALFRLPFQQDIYLIIEDSKAEANFHLQSFNQKENYTIQGKLLTNEEIQSLSIPKHKPKSFNDSDSFYMNQSEYEEYVNEIVALCQSNETKKIVAARKKKHPIQLSNIAQVFNQLCTHYEHAFINLHHSPLGCWVGATPEILLKNQEKSYQTVALAGTKQINDDSPWNAKEIEEQQIVTDYIIQNLKELEVTKVKQSKPYTFSAGNIKHLKTDIQFEAYSLKPILNALHPTPAICGIPKQFAFDYIQQKERNSRELYSGLIGFSFKNRTHYYVNLRCMRIFKDHVDIYVGAGITNDSIPQNEWTETENKSRTILNVL